MRPTITFAELSAELAELPIRIGRYLLTVQVTDILDIAILVFVLYKILALMRTTRAASLLKGLFVFFAALLLSYVLQLNSIYYLMSRMVQVGVLALIILFQEEIRRFLLTLGSHRHIKKFVNFFTGNKQADVTHEDIMPIVMACVSMGRQKVGALIVIEHDMPLDDVVRTGDLIDANINQRLIENIFFKNSPLHDGAMVISKKRIKAAGCILPVSHNLDIPKELGLRHRAALGISQVSDAHAIIVSEETGGISVAYKGQFYLRLNAEGLESLLTKQ